MTQSDLDTERLAASFAFSDRLLDQEFRQYLKSLGWQSGQHIVPALDTEQISEVTARMNSNGTPPPCLIAIPNAEERFGFWFLFVDLAPVRTRKLFAKRVPTVRINPAATIGMLHDSLKPCGDYLPSDWAQPMRFERVVTPA
jgi:hypothetical protein